MEKLLYLVPVCGLVALLFALFTVAGGVRLKGSLVGTPVVNTGILAVGTILASWMGTTGAAMLLIRPLLRANAHRKYRVHSVVFFIFLVANIGGSLTPLGDPPLFLGYLKGVSFFWTTTNLFVKTCFMPCWASTSCSIPSCTAVKVVPSPRMIPTRWKKSWASTAPSTCSSCWASCSACWSPA